MEEEKISLWSVLSKEEDLLVFVLKLLDPTSLKNIEASCSQFRDFIRSAQLWKIMFNQNYPNFLENVKNEEVVKKLSTTMAWDDHYKYKRLSLKLRSLKENWSRKSWSERNLDLNPVFGGEVIKAVNTDLILSVSSSAFFSRIANVFDLSKWRKEREAKVQRCSEMHILSAHIATEHIVLFGEPKVRDFHFHLELLARPDLSCIKESHGLTFEVLKRETTRNLSALNNLLYRWPPRGAQQSCQDLGWFYSRSSFSFLWSTFGQLLVNSLPTFGQFNPQRCVNHV